MTDTVLIIDDSLTVRMDLAEAFAAAGFDSIIPCATAADTRTALARERVDIVILDVVLPDGDGVELLKEIRASESAASAVVLMLSTETEVKDRIRGLQTGADEYVGKPYDTAYVVAKAQELLQVRRTAAGDRTLVLVIDDSVTFREALRTALAARGYHVLTAATGEDGLRVAALQRPDVILVDGMLPGIDGATVIRRIRLDAALRDVPCLLLTASTDTSAELRALDAGADTFVRKEEEVDVILAKLAAVLRRAFSREQADEATRSLLGPKKILAVDDSLTYLQELASALRGEGYDVVLARSGEEAIELLGIQAVDCILLDLLMPGLSGQETCQRIKSAPTVRETPVVMLTALEDRDAMIQGLSAGADDYISKSSEFEVLKARVRAQLRRKQFEDENRRIREELLRKEVEATEARAAHTLADTRARLVEQLEQKNRELESFSYSVSHDLRAPLRAIEGFRQILVEEYAEPLNDEGRTYLRHIGEATRQMDQLIDDLLGLARITGTEITRTDVALSALVHRVVDHLRVADPQRAVSVTIEEGVIANGDAGLLAIVLENLLGNAWKFTANREHASIVFGSDLQRGVRTYFVRDNGAGFDMAHAAKLFEPFQRLHSRGEYEGTGIGLATVQRIVNRHGGRIWAEGQVDGGATFFFTLGPSST
jgi:DNA-binding response OmpR family regulator